MMSTYEYRIEQKVKEEFEKKEQREKSADGNRKVMVLAVDQIQDVISVDVGNKQLYRRILQKLLILRDCNLLLNYEAREQFGRAAERANLNMFLEYI